MKSGEHALGATAGVARARVERQPAESAVDKRSGGRESVGAQLTEWITYTLVV